MSIQDMIMVTGFVAGGLTTLSFVPQVSKTFRTKSTKDFSFGMLTLLMTGIFLWLLYGIGTKAWPVIIANAISFVLIAALFAMKLRFR